MRTANEAKRSQYLQLVAERKACAACPELSNAAGIEGGRFDAEEIGPYSRWQGNLDAELMVVGQDFADVNGFIANDGWPGNRVATNRVQAAVPGRCFERCGRQFLRPLIEIVQPKLVVTLGAKAAGAVGRAFGLEPLPALPAPGQLPRPMPLTARGPTMLMCVHHPSRTVQNTTRSADAQRADWREVGRVLHVLKLVAA